MIAVVVRTDRTPLPDPISNVNEMFCLSFGSFSEVSMTSTYIVERGGGCRVKLSVAGIQPSLRSDRSLSVTTLDHRESALNATRNRAWQFGTDLPFRSPRTFSGSLLAGDPHSPRFPAGGCSSRSPALTGQLLWISASPLGRCPWVKKETALGPGKPPKRPWGSNFCRSE